MTMHICVFNLIIYFNVIYLRLMTNFCLSYSLFKLYYFRHNCVGFILSTINQKGNNSKL